MPLTRHFYASDEVLSALFYTSSRRDIKETEFWCRELLISGYSSEAISVLFESWLWQRGPFYLQWLLHAKTLTVETVTEEDILRAAVELSSCGEWDNSLLAVLSSTEGAERVTPKTPSIMSDSDEILYLYRAIHQGKARSAWLMVQRLQKNGLENVLVVLKEYGHLSPEYEEIFGILEKYETLLGYRSEAYDTVILCFATLMLCLSDQKRKSSFMPRTIKWSPMMIPIGRRAARMYSIPSVALYGIKQTTALDDVEKYIRGCPFWDDVLEVANELDKDAFYDQYFPDDIPDEWTRSEKEKSHSSFRPDPSVEKYTRIHFSKPTRLCWNSVITMTDFHPISGIKYGIYEINMKPLRRKYKAY
jgi:hypothetical protein